MSKGWLNNRDSAVAVAASENAEDLLVANCLAAAAQGDITAYFDLGVAYSTGSHGAECDLVEAHKWFNLAAVAGHEEAQMCRADVADEMSAREIAEAQRRAREWIAASARRAA
jgi:TPR repeat protein